MIVIEPFYDMVEHWNIVLFCVLVLFVIMLLTCPWSIWEDEGPLFVLACAIGIPVALAVAAYIIMGVTQFLAWLLQI